MSLQGLRLCKFYFNKIPNVLKFQIETCCSNYLKLPATSWSPLKPSKFEKITPDVYKWPKEFGIQTLQSKLGWKLDKSFGQKGR